MSHTYVFFFKQKTAYEMRISDWSSDVCSSDLKASPRNSGPLSVRRTCGRPWSDLSCSKMRIRRVDEIEVSTSMCSASRLKSSTTLKVRKRRSEERRVGKECVSRGRSRWSPDH